MELVNFISETDTSRFDKIGEKAWQEQGLCIAHIQDRRLSSSDRATMRSIAIKLKYGKRI